MNKNLKTANTEVAWMQITAGRGPKECAWVVARLSKIITRAAAKAGLSVEWVEALAFDKALRNQQLIDTDAYRSVVLRIEGADAGVFARAWHGSILWQGESRFRLKRKRRNWFVGVNVFQLPEISKPDDEAELLTQVKIETMRAAGPGGQHVNKTDSAVRVTHLPTGIQVRVDSQRSQHKNRQRALERLRMLLDEQRHQKLKRLEHFQWQNHQQLECGAPRRIFQGLEFKEK